jgi:hypothetical protein
MLVGRYRRALAHAMGAALCASPTIASSAQAVPMMFRLASKTPNCHEGICSWIAADGEITHDTPDDFLNFLHTNGINGNRWLIINSPGGDLAAAHRLFFMLGGFNIRVGKTNDDSSGQTQSFSGGVCENACILVLMSGTKREVSEGSKVLVSSFIRPSDRVPDAPYSQPQSAAAAASSATQTTVSELHALAERHRIDYTVVGLMTSGEAIQLSRQDMESWNLLTTRSSPPAAHWALSQQGDSLAATATQLQNDGRQIDYRISCKSFDVLIPEPEAYSDAIDVRDHLLAGEDRARVADDNVSRPDADLKLLSAVLVNGEGLHLSYSINDTILKRIGASPKPLSLVFEPSEEDSWAFDNADSAAFLLPSSNGSGVLDQLDHSCTENAPNTRRDTSQH